jgi:histidinol dehydrogenase
MSATGWKLRPVEDLPELRRDPVDAETLVEAAAIVKDVRERGEEGVREHAVRLGDLGAEAPLLFGPQALRDALEALPTDQRDLLLRVGDRVAAFAQAQRQSVAELDVDILGGRAGHTIAPVQRAGCYAPGGRFPLPSSVIMTALTARVAGVQTVWVASPRPQPITLAAAALAGADGLLAVGGAQAIAALAYGAGDVPACDIVVGPGNRWVTAAKQLVSGRVRIDMLAGPSELVVLADGTADPVTVAADLLAQAEHDPDAVPILVATDAGLPARVDAELAAQLATLPTADTASRALKNGFAVSVADVAEGVAVCNRLAPEHLELILANPEDAVSSLRHYGGLFVGSATAEVLGDYGAGPNHTLPTGSTARFVGGLSVLTFLRHRTWIRIDDLVEAQPLVRDAAALARIEGLEAHARSAERRLK